MRTISTRNRPHYSRSEYFERSGMPLCVFVVKAQTEHRFHDHDFTELVVVASGKGEHATTREEYPIEKGDVFVLHRAETHSYRDTHGLRIYNVVFDLDNLNLPFWDLDGSPGFRALFTLEPRLRARHGFRSRLKLSPTHLAIVIDLLENILKEHTSKKPGYKCMACSLFLQVAGFLSRCYTNIDDPESRGLLRLGAVLEHMENCIDSKLSLEKLATMANMSKSSFQRAFRRMMDSSPIDYLIKLRIYKACELLAEENMTITEIAMNVGFDDSNYFTRQFHKITKMSPREYRQRLPEQKTDD